MMNTTTINDYTDFIISGKQIPQQRVVEGADDVNAGTETLRVWGLDGFDNDVQGVRGIAGKVNGNLAFELSEQRGLIAGFDFNDTKMIGGNTPGEFTGVQSGDGDTRAFFAGADDADGANARFFARADGKVRSDAFGEILISTIKDASTGINTSSPPSFSFQWGVETTCAGSGCSTSTIQRNKRQAAFVKKFSQDTLAVNLHARTVSSQSGSSVYEFGHFVTIQIHDVFAASTVIDEEHEIATNSQPTESFEVDISSLDDGKEYLVRLGVRATVTRTIGGGSGSQGDASTEISDRSIVFIKT